MTRHLKNSYASETPVTDGERVYVYFGAIGMVAALDFDGEVLWTKETGTFNTMLAMATASSPALHEDRLYVLNDNTTQSFLTALDTVTGEEVWRGRPAGGWADLGHAARVGEPAAHRDRDLGQQPGPVV